MNDLRYVGGLASDVNTQRGHDMSELVTLLEITISRVMLENGNMGITIDSPRRYDGHEAIVLLQRAQWEINRKMLEDERE
jgi:hypothetical protein